MMHFLHTGGKLLLASSVYDMHLSAQTQSRSCRIHGHVSAADHSDLLTAHDGGIGILAEGLHQVASGQIFVGGKYAVCILTGNSHELGKSCAGADEHGGKSFLIQELVDGDGFAHDHVGLDLHAKRLHVFNFLLHNGFLGKTEFRNTINQHAAGLVKGLKNGHVVAHLRQIARAGKACRAGTDHGYLLAFLFRGAFRLDAVLSGPVSHKTLQLTDGNGLALDASDTFSFALALLRADAAADSRKGGGSADHLIGGLHISFLHLLDEAGNVDGYGTALHTLCVFAVNASGSLFHRFFSVISQADLLKIGRSDLSILFPDGYLF